MHPQSHEADGGGHTRVRQTAAACGGGPRRLAVLGCLPVAEAAGSGIMLSAASFPPLVVHRGRVLGQPVMR
jgi:hypothetical protein